MSIARTLILAGSLAVAGTLPAGAQNFNADPIYGTVRLNAGFLPDPQVVNLTSGGSVAASNISSSCRGYIANAPDVRLYYDSGNYPLIISVDSGSDTTLVVNAPDGRWYCDDDSGEGLNPSIRFNGPMSGRYEIWVGSYAAGNNASASLYISEVGSQ